MTNLYINTREAAYRHHIVGVYDTLEKAHEGAKVAVKIERDDHHSIRINICTVNNNIQDVEPVGEYRKLNSGVGTEYVELSKERYCG